MFKYYNIQGGKKVNRHVRQNISQIVYFKCQSPLPIFPENKHSGILFSQISRKTWAHDDVVGFESLDWNEVDHN